ncbi:MAG: glycoside hydrolase family 3 protein [Butyrivibrio sp.]|nr:glycoside hydrolase family 3 protein [Butyrivibrio sp.]
MAEKIWSKKAFAATARRVSADGIVLLENDGTLPLESGTRLAVFGRSQFNYYRCGTGSGGAVNVEYTVGIYDALEADPRFELNQTVRAAYEAWLVEHPFDSGHGWGTEPWTQEEMPLPPALVDEASAASDVALILIGRTAGEDQDNYNEPGSYLLTEVERDMLQQVCNAFPRSIVLLNTGNIMDMRWVAEVHPSAVAYVWQGGQEGGNGVLDFLSGDSDPAGHLADTIAARIEDYPSTAHFGDPEQNLYVEDIYVGYRYFETFARDCVLYPFGYGLTYTSFDLNSSKPVEEGDSVTFALSISNTGMKPGRAVAQIYVQRPIGHLGQPARVLAGFHKSQLLAPGALEQVTLRIPCYDFASYDDSGASGYAHAYVLEAGDYNFYLGENVRDAQPIGTLQIPETRCLMQLEEAMAPVTAFDRMVNRGGSEPDYAPVPLCLSPQDQKCAARKPACPPYTGDRGYKLADVDAGKVSMADFVAQIPDEELCVMMRGEGMSSAKVTPGIAGAYGGVSDTLKAFGIPVAGCSDGPSGIRMDCGTQAFSLPNGTSIACTWDTELAQALFAWEALDMRKNHVDALLGPGMNIHRNPLNGRNFEYFSEDPFLTGQMAAAQLKGMHRYDVTGVIKHFAGNSQELKRHRVNNVISERALREIYLKGFEIAVRQGGAYAVMSTYGPVNGVWTSSNYDLLTVILRNEWGFDGIVMTDWWAMGNDAAGEPGSYKNVAAQVRAQNDLNMVNADPVSNSNRDNLAQALSEGTLTRAELARCAENICRYLLRTPAYQHFLGHESDLDRELAAAISASEASLQHAIPVRMLDEIDLDVSLINTEKGHNTIFGIYTEHRGAFRLELTLRATGGNPLAQIPVTVFRDIGLLRTITMTGDMSEWRTETVDIPVNYLNNYFLRFFFAQSGLEIQRARLVLVQDLEEEIQRGMDQR